MSVTSQLFEIEGRIAASALMHGRSPNSVRLLAVSKTFPSTAIREAYSTGIRAFGESKVQELERKVAELSDLTDIEWHLIGHLQGNKAARAVELADWIHSVDSVKLLERIDRVSGELNRRPHVLLEINTSDEESKSGVADPAAVADLVAAAAVAKHLDFCGFMTMAPLTEDRSLWIRSFDRLAKLRASCEKELKRPLPELSMGMSGDFDEAISCGATIVRIGSAIFGMRDYSKVE